MIRAGLVLVLVWGGTAGCSRSPGLEFTEAEREIILSHSRWPAAPDDPSNEAVGDSDAIELGRILFFDTRLSGNGRVACASCHNPFFGWSDGRSTARGVGQGVRNTPTLWNVAYHRWFFWDGRADSLWSQALQPIESPAEMNGSRLQLAHLVRTDPILRGLYARAFRSPADLSDTNRFPAEGRPFPAQPEHYHHENWARMDPADQETVNRMFANLGKAIAAFEHTILSRHSPFDRFALDLAAGRRPVGLSASAQRGLKLFVGRGRCSLCHSGPMFSDSEFHNLGLFPIPGVRRDMGRFEGVPHVLKDPFSGAGAYSHRTNGSIHKKTAHLTPNAAQRGQFRTPTLRNVARTAPYMHGGQFATLDRVLEFYSTLAESSDVGYREETLVPLNLTRPERDDLVAFLNSLTDEISERPFQTSTSPTQEGPVGSRPNRQAAGDYQRGKTLYWNYCVPCHQTDGRGMFGRVGADFVGDPSRLGKSDEELLRSISDGRTGISGAVMPAWGHLLSREQMGDAVAFIRKEFGSDQR